MAPLLSTAQTNIFTEHFNTYSSMYLRHGDYNICRIPDDGNCLIEACLFRNAFGKECGTIRNLIAASIVVKVLCLSVPPIDMDNDRLYDQVTELIDINGDTLAPETVIEDLKRYESGAFEFAESEDLVSPLNELMVDDENPVKRRKKTPQKTVYDKLFEPIISEFMIDKNHKLTYRDVYQIVVKAITAEGSWIGTEMLDFLASILRSNIHVYFPNKKEAGQYSFLQQYGEQYQNIIFLAFHPFELDVDVTETQTR